LRNESGARRAHVREKEKLRGKRSATHRSMKARTPDTTVTRGMTKRRVADILRPSDGKEQTMKQRITDTSAGMQGAITTEIFDRYARDMRDKGRDNLDAILASGIAGGHALELGPGPGYVGLEWLKKVPGTKLTGCEISPDMIKLALRNARAYGLEARASYVRRSALKLPFPNRSFSAVFSNGTLHAWEDAALMFREIARVVKHGGAFCVCDMRRDASPFAKWSLRFRTNPKEVRPGLKTSIAAAYTEKEVKELLAQAPLYDTKVVSNSFGLMISGFVE
jgi:ubiquinone/menaquinone biosynthesis C-methylase UbiE